MFQKQNTPDISSSEVPSDLSEAEATSALLKGHDYMNKVLASRHRNLQIVRALWTGGNMKVSAEPNEIYSPHEYSSSQVIFLLLLSLLLTNNSVRNWISEVGYLARAGAKKKLNQYRQCLFHEFMNIKLSKKVDYYFISFHYS